MLQIYQNRGFICFRLLTRYSTICFKFIRTRDSYVSTWFSSFLAKFFSQFAKRIQELAEDKAENKLSADFHKNHLTTKFNSSKLLPIANLRAPRDGRRYSPSGGFNEF